MVLILTLLVSMDTQPIPHSKTDCMLCQVPLYSTMKHLLLLLVACNCFIITGLRHCQRKYQQTSAQLPLSHHCETRENTFVESCMHLYLKCSRSHPPSHKSRLVTSSKLSSLTNKPYCCIYCVYYCRRGGANRPGVPQGQKGVRQHSSSLQVRPRRPRCSGPHVSQRPLRHYSSGSQRDCVII